MYYKNVLEECTIMPNADKVCQKLKEEGHSIQFITARLINIRNCNTEKITKRTLLENNILYDKLIINASNKLKVCKEEKIDLFIDDSYDTCRELEKIGIKTYLMTTKMNEQIDVCNLSRVYNWEEIYNEIQKIGQKLSS